MDTATFEKLRFVTSSKSSSITTDLLKRFFITNDTMRILDLGCGDGQTLLELGKTMPDADLTGIDVSAFNIQLAKEAHAREMNRNILFLAKDYLEYETKPFHIIYAESVLHLIAAEDDLLFAKLSHDLKPNGILIVTMPYDCLYNRVLIRFRKILQSLRCPLFDTMLLAFARLIYPSIDKQILKDRLPYMYLIPKRLDSILTRKTLMEKYQLRVLESYVCEDVSFVKPKHKLIIFQKNEPTTDEV